MNSLLRRSLRPRPITAWVCRRYYSTPVPDQGLTPARTRFAPSPTGFLHLGSLRTALYNYLYAKKTGGQFILRIEDTDQKRTVPGAEESIFDTLRWAGLQWDEGPQVGGPYGPYRQSERSELHREHAELLRKSGHAYRCFCGPKRLSVLASKRLSTGLPVEYDRHCHSLSLIQSDARAAAGEAHVIRLKVPDEYPAFTDTVYGTIKYGENKSAHAQGSFEDPILLKSDGMPTYHLANVVDDHFMHITHVIRATEWMPSTPKHEYLYSCFGWDAPKWVHVGLLQDKMRVKLSKRTGSVMVEDYKQQGYTAETLNNFVALLGWSHGGEGRSDVLDMKELIELFDVSKLTQGNTVVNFEKLRFLQKSHVRRRVESSKECGDEELAKVEKEIRTLYGDEIETGAPLTTSYVRTILHINLQNYTTPHQFATASAYFFISPTFDSDHAIRSIKNLAKFRKQSGASISEIYHGFLDALDDIPDTKETWTVDRLRMLLDYERQIDELIWGYRLRLLRLALCGGLSGPTMAETLWALGKERSLQRLRGVEKAFEGVEGEIKEWAEKSIFADVLIEEKEEEKGQGKRIVKGKKEDEHWERKVRKHKAESRKKKAGEGGR